MAPACCAMALLQLWLQLVLQVAGKFGLAAGCLAAATSAHEGGEGWGPMFLGSLLSRTLQERSTGRDGTLAEVGGRLVALACVCVPVKLKHLTRLLLLLQGADSQRRPYPGYCPGGRLAQGPHR